MTFRIRTLALVAALCVPWAPAHADSTGACGARYIAPGVSSYNATEGDNGTLIGAASSSGAGIIVSLPDPASVSQNWVMCGASENNKQVAFSAPLLTAPATPSLSQISGGTQGARTRYVKITFTNSLGETVASSESSFAVSANALLVVGAPAIVGNATGWNVYVGTAPGNETGQNVSPISLLSNFTEAIGGLISGKALPSTGTAPLAYILDGDQLLTKFFVAGGNYQTATVLNDGANYRVVSASTETRMFNGSSSGFPARILFPGGPGYQMTQADNGFAVSSASSSAGLTVTLPSITGLAVGWTTRLQRDSGKDMIVQRNSFSGGTIVFPGGTAASINLAPADGELIELQFDGAVFRLLFGSQASLKEIGAVWATDSVPNNAALKLLKGSVNSRITRNGFAAQGDGGDGPYTWGSVNCVHPDDGMEVQPTAIAGCWKYDLASANGMVRGEQYGAAGDGVTDDAPEFALAAAALDRAGGGTIRLLNKKYLIDTNLDLRTYKDIRIEGNIAAYGSASMIGQTANYLTRPYTFIINTAANRSIYFGHLQSMAGVNVVRKGITTPTTRHQLQAEINNFAGQGLVCDSYSDVKLEKLTLIGFAQAIATNCERITMTDIMYDTANGKGIWGTASSDFTHWTRVESWPFLHATANDALTMTVTGAVNNGSGLIRITVSAPPAETLVTGDTVSVGNVGGVPNALGRWVITAVNSTTFDLVGSTFAGTFTSGGSAVYKPIRHGSAMWLENGTYSLHAFQNYGNDVGLNIQSSISNPTYVSCDGNCQIAGWPSPDPVPVGLNIVGANIAQVNYQGAIQSTGTGLGLNAASATVRLTDTYIEGASGGEPQYPMSLVSGALIGSGVVVSTLSGTRAAFMGHGMSSVNLTNSLFLSDADYRYEGNDIANLCWKIALNGVTLPCPWTPGLSFGGASTGITYSGQNVGTYTKSLGTGEVHLSARLLLTSKGTATGVAEITGLPVTGNAVISTACPVAFHSGMNTGSVTGWENYVPLGTSKISLGGFSGRYDDTYFTNSSNIFFGCVVQP